MNKKVRNVLLLGLLVVFIAGVVIQFAGSVAAFPDELYLEGDLVMGEVVDIGIESTIPLAGTPALMASIAMPSADGKVVFENTSAVIDASNSADGYVMIKHVGKSDKNLKVIITGPSNVAYTYNLNQNGDYEVFPLSDGSGSYKIAVYRNISGTKYSTLLSKSTTVKLTDEFAPFLRPNQYVNYKADGQVVKKAAELCKTSKTEIQKVQTIYNFVIKELTYDKDKAKQVTDGKLTGYLPDVDAILKAKKGICFDYAAVMASMLRSQGVPTKLVVGYAGEVYHAWINTYSDETGWVEGVVFFDGKEWKLMDPTFASSANSSAKIMEYIGDGNNYSAKFLY